MSSGIKWFCGSFLATMSSSRVAKIFAEVVGMDLDTGDKPKLCDVFSVDRVNGEFVELGIVDDAKDFYETLEYLNETVHKFGGTLSGYAVVEYDNGELCHVGFTEDGDIKEFDVYDIIAVSTDKMSKIKKYVESLNE